MPITLRLLLVLCVAWTGTVHAAGPASSSLAGRWTLEVQRMPLPPDARPQSVTIAFVETADGLSMDVEIVDGAGKHLRMTSTARLDGTPIALDANPEADIAAMRMPEPGVLVLGLGRAGMPASTRVYTVDGAGTGMTEVASYVGSDGKPLLRVNHFIRVEPR